MDQRTPLQALIEELNTSPADVLLKYAQQCPTNPNIQITIAILNINLNKSSEALQILKTLKDHPLYQYTHLYALYKDTQYTQVINEARKNVPEDMLILAQSYAKSEQFNQAIEVYQQILKENKFTSDTQDIITNLINAAIQSNDQNKMKLANQLATDYVKKQKNQCSRELLLNHALLNLALLEYKQAKEIIIRFENMVRFDNEQDDDLLLAQLVLDLLEQDNYQAKVKHYETIEKSTEQPIVLNNMAVYQEKIHTHHDTLKRIEEALAYEYKFTPQQLNTLKINKAIVQIVRNRPVKELGLPTTLLIALNRAKWQTPIDDLQQYLIFATNNDNSHNILTQLNVKNWAQNKVLATFIAAHLLKVDDTQFPHLIAELKTHQKKLLCQLHIKKGNIDQALATYEEDETLKGQLALLCIEKGKLQQGEQFIGSLHYQAIEDLTELENLEKNVGLSKKVVETAKKIQKKQKKRIRYPKNFDKLNPGPLPNPERWMARHDRKEWKKKKLIKSRTQGAGQAGKETMNTFQATGATSANLNATKKKNKNRR